MTRIEAAPIPSGNHIFWVLTEEGGESNWEWLEGDEEKVRDWAEEEFRLATEQSEQVAVSAYEDNYYHAPNCAVDFFFQIRTDEVVNV